MADPQVDGAAAKDGGTMTPPPVVTPATPHTPEPMKPVIAAAPPEPVRPVGKSPELAALEAQMAEKVKALDEVLGKANAYTERDRNARVLARLRQAGAIASDATLLLLAPRDADPDTAEGRTKLDKLREIEPALFRQVVPDAATQLAAAAKLMKPPESYKGRYDEKYAERIANGVIRRATGGE